MGFVYVLSNPAMPGLVKIGRTDQDDVRRRIDQLYTPAVPFPFETRFVCRVPISREVERALHIAFAPQRVPTNREFFEIEPEQAIAILKLLDVQDATNEIEAMPSEISSQEKQAGAQYNARRPNLNFKEMGIPVGSLLTYINSEDNEITVTVISDRQVKFGDEQTFLTTVTRTLLGLDYSVQPSPYWTYEGKKLKEIYEETYSHY